ncbi:ribosome recycling factor [Candidatus Nomurabacteria bacterium RIFCSPHIGHO2_02_FULL_38_15]|uniref:Ribosome recycling factor n=1 Tax=Candidatus Nomurabacteria bacterium RIFCSPHIGHO2_02_FULL_38_15 TaxID=1801752 RepID=A0A1F6VSA7_9BACT|nr:MAG: ribosome recycling factor [Candidatus Nomurabacteria bacterium RIFCSPHIGHO2_02_FULL_38_15]
MYNFTQTKEAFKNTHEWLAHEFSTLHSGKASPMILDGVMVDSYGSNMPIKNVASVTIEDSKTLRVSPWDKSQVKVIEKAINDANIGLSVVCDADGLRVIFPMLTTETRSKMVKILKDLLEEARIRVRKEREKTQEDIRASEKSGNLDEDSKFRALDELQKLVDEANNNLEQLFDKKERDVMTV